MIFRVSELWASVSGSDRRPWVYPPKIHDQPRVTVTKRTGVLMCKCTTCRVVCKASLGRAGVIGKKVTCWPTLIQKIDKICQHSNFILPCQQCKCLRKTSLYHRDCSSLTPFFDLHFITASHHGVSCYRPLSSPMD